MYNSKIFESGVYKIILRGNTAKIELNKIPLYLLYIAI